MIRKFCGSLFAASLLLWGPVSALAEVPESGEAAWRREYLRPPIPSFPEDNPYTAAKAELGRRLFFDPILSGSGTHSCASCHNPSLSWGDGLPRAVGEGPAPLPLRAPTLLGIAWTPRLGWDGKFPDLEAVTFAPIIARANMNLGEADVIRRLATNSGYARAFANIFGENGVTRRNIEMALATYERTIIPGEAPFDRWIAGDEAAIGEAAKRGFDLFKGRAGCSACHSGWAFTDGSFHDIGIAQGEDLGRGRLFPTSVKLRHAFKTPTLRDAARRAPYMHDGSIPTLDAVIALYDRGGIERPSRSELIHPLGLSAGEKADLVAFLRTLTSYPEPAPVPVLPR